MQELQVPSLQYHQKGVVLLESLIAILVFSLAVLALVGLQATMVKNAADAKYRAEASFIAQQRIGEMWADPAKMTGVKKDVTTNLPNGRLNVSTPVNGQFTVTVGWTAPGETPSAAGSEPCVMDVPVAHCFRTIATVAGG